MLVLTLKEGEGIETNVGLNFSIHRINPSSIVLGFKALDNVKIQRTGKKPKKDKSER